VDDDLTLLEAESNEADYETPELTAGDYLTLERISAQQGDECDTRPHDDTGTTRTPTAPRS
jgi:hypothetical protein